jgi:hypothetical protein
MKVHEKIKTAMDETRLLLLGAQILLGFQINGIFQERFSSLPASSRWMAACAFLLMTITAGLLISPAMRHRLVNQGNASRRLLKSTTRFAAVALLPLAVSLCIDLYIAVEHTFGAPLAFPIAAVFLCGALLSWHLIPFLARKSGTEIPMPAEAHTPIQAKVEQMLTEARVLLPGAQALLGFQLAIMFTTAFSELPVISKAVHLLALCCISMTIVLLMAPAAFHRITFRGEDSEDFHRLGSRFIVSAAVPLALGLSCDLFVGSSKATGSFLAGACLGVGAFSGLIFFWFVQPLMLRARERTRERTS